MESDFNRPFVYVAGSLANREGVMRVSNFLRKKGFEVFDDWLAPGPKTDYEWQEFEEARGNSYLEALHQEHAQWAFRFDDRHVQSCSAMVIVLPCGKSAHLELGIVLGSGQPGFIFMPEPPEKWDLMYLYATKVVIGDLEALAKCLSNIWPKLTD